MHAEDADAHEHEREHKEPEDNNAVQASATIRTRKMIIDPSLQGVELTAIIGTCAYPLSPHHLSHFLHMVPNGIIFSFSFSVNQIDVVSTTSSWLLQPLHA